ncbi:uncharacterized protein LOC115034566 [Acyrthosiphon pisum]|uniref:Activin types I and II receptor domain-containing protein n=1 Tax=Acyrthosiphon pisum TaxID=7029 RepID=A0A8R2NX20_ACYPI|nr:uncharacterized protein LOC115034566 [Acyrthosiphon pisum]
MRGTTLMKKKDYLFINLNPCKELICTLCPPGKNFKRQCDSSTHRNCTTNNIDCKLGKEPAYCYATWHNNTLLNQVVITGKSCTNRQDCSQPRYVNTTRSLRDKMYCCCNSSLCNNNVEWVPEINSEPSDKTIIIIIGYIVAFICIFVLYKSYQCVSNFNNRQRYM